MGSGTGSDAGSLCAWRRFTLAACMFLCVAAFGFIEPFVPLYLELSGLNRSEIGLVTGIGAGLALVIQPFLGRLSDRLDARRPLMLAAAVVAGCAYLFYRQANSLLLFMLLGALGANAVLYLNTANAVLVGRIATNGGKGPQCGTTFAAYRVWGSLGYVALSLLAGWLLNRGLGTGEMTRAGLSPLFLYVPLLFVVIGAVVLLVPDPKREALAVQPGAEATLPDEGTPARQRCDHNLRRFLRAYFLFIFAYTGSSAYLSLHLKSLGATPFWVTGVFAAGVLCEALVMSQVGRLSDRFGRRPLLAVAFLVMPLRLLLYIPAPGPMWVLCVQTLHGINFGIMVAVAVAFISDLCSEENRGAAQAKLAGTSGLAAALGPAIGGWVAQRFGIPWNFALMACFAAAGVAVFMWKVRESHPHPVRLYRLASGTWRPILQLLYVPVGWISRGRRIRGNSE